MNSRSLSAASVLAFAVTGLACAQPGRDGKPIPAGSAAATAPNSEAGTPATVTGTDYVEGPNGERLIGFTPDSPEGKLNFKQVSGSAWKVQVVGSDASFELARLPATFATALGDEICTATLIGPQVLLTAAHCVDVNRRRGAAWQTRTGSVSLADGGGGQDIHSCAMAPAYTASDYRAGRVRNENDYALCELLLPLNVIAEPIALGVDQIAPQAQLLIAGFGCSEQDLVGGRIVADNPTSGILHVGINRISGGGPDGWINLKGQIGTADAIICPGDSGGAAYSNASLIPRNDDRGWRVVAVNSAVGPTGKPEERRYLSYLAPLADPDFKTFLDGWVAKRPTYRQICGQEPRLGTKCRQ